MICTIKLDVPFTQKEKYVIASILTCLADTNTPKGQHFISTAFQELNIDIFEMNRIVPEIVESQGQDALFGIIRAMNSNKKKVAQQYFGKALIDGDGKNNQEATLIFHSLLETCGLADANINIPTINNKVVNIRLDSSVKSISRTAAYHLSSVIANGIILSNNNNVVIYKDYIDFGKCNNPEYTGRTGCIFQNFYMEYGKLIYRFGANLKCGWLWKKIDYVGNMAPSVPDNKQIYDLLYPRFA